MKVNKGIKYLFLIFSFIFFLFVLSVNLNAGPNNNLVCNDFATCEYMNLTSALQGENNTANTINLVENNTVYTLSESTRYYLLGDGVINLNNNYNVTIDCNGTEFTRNTSVGTVYGLFQLKDSHNITLKNCVFRVLSKTAVKVVNVDQFNFTNNTMKTSEWGAYVINSSNIYFYNNNFTDTEDSIYLIGSANYVEIYNNLFFGNWTVGTFSVNLDDYTNITIRNNIYDNMKQKAINFQTSSNVLVENDTVRNIGETNSGVITVYDFSNGHENSEIVNSTFKNISGNMQNIFLINNISSIRIINNNFTNVRNVIMITSLQSQNITIQGNSFSNIYLDYAINTDTSSNYKNQNISIINNSFNNLTTPLFLSGLNFNIINNTFNNTGSQRNGYFTDYSPITYNDIDFDCVIFSNSIGTFNYANDLENYVNIVDGETNFTRFWLFTDDASPITNCGANANITAYVEDGYANSCVAIAGVFGGTCNLAYESNTVWEAFGYGNQYIFNSSILNDTLYISGNNKTPTLKYNGYFHQFNFPIKLNSLSNSNITGNSFYSKNTNFSSIEDFTYSYNNTFWYNNFYIKGFNESQNNSGCYNGEGNFYDKRISYDKMARGECGLVNITFLNDFNTDTFQIPTVQSNMIDIKWDNQSSYNSITYYLEWHSDLYGWNTIGTTADVEWNDLDLTGYPNDFYTINIIPLDSATVSIYIGLIGEIVDGKMIGEFDGDGIVSSSDMGILNILKGDPTAFDTNPNIDVSTADFNNDGIIDNTDVEILASYLSGNVITDFSETVYYTSSHFGTYRNITFLLDVLAPPPGSGVAGPSGGTDPETGEIRCIKGYHLEDGICVEDVGLYQETLEVIDTIKEEVKDFFINWNKLRFGLLVIAIVILFLEYMKNKKNYYLIGLGVGLILLVVFLREEFFIKNIQPIIIKAIEFIKDIFNSIMDIIKIGVDFVMDKLGSLF